VDCRGTGRGGIEGAGVSLIERRRGFERRRWSPAHAPPTRAPTSADWGHNPSYVPFSEGAAF